MNYKKISIKKIRPNPNQPRQHFDEARIRELADSIQRHGLNTPILVRVMSRDIFEIVHGERRFRACQLLGLETIRAEVRELDDEQAYMLSLIENIQREDLTPMEEAEAYQILLSDGLSQTGLGEQIGKGQSYISNKLRLLNLPAGIRTLMRHGQLCDGHGRQLLRFKKIFPEGLKSYAKFQSGALSIELAEYPIEEQRGYFTLFNESYKPDASPRPLLGVLNRAVLAEDISTSLICEFLAEQCQDGEQPLQWEINTFYFGLITSIVGLSVRDLKEWVDSWKLRYLHNLFMWWHQKDDKSEWDASINGDYMAALFLDLACASSLFVELELDDIGEAFRSMKTGVKTLVRIHEDGEREYDEEMNYVLPSPMQPGGWMTDETEEGVKVVKKKVKMNEIRLPSLPLDYEDIASGLTVSLAKVELHAISAHDLWQHMNEYITNNP